MPEKATKQSLSEHMGFKATIPAGMRRIVTDVKLMPAHKDGENPPIFDIECKGLWDTGAQASTISVDLAKKLNLPVIGQRKMKGAGGPYDANVYLAGLILPNSVKVSSISLAGFAGSPAFDMLIGMDIILHGDFLISAAKDVIHFSYQFPSSGGFYLTGIHRATLHNGVICELDSTIHNLES